MGSDRPFKATPIALGAVYRAKRMRGRINRLVLPLVVLVGAATIGGAVGVLPVIDTKISHFADGATVTGCKAVDGDTLRCGSERIRLLAIDAPELAGHCRKGRVCAPGDPYASTASLADALSGELNITRVGEDRYGRTLALITGSKGDLSCWQLEQGQAVYKSAWDNGARVASICPAAVR